MHAESITRRFRILTFIIPALAMAGCGTGGGPESITGTAATPLPPGFCGNINFEIPCPRPMIVNFGGGATTFIDNPDISGINTSDSVAQMQKFPDEVFGGTKFDLADPIDFANGEAYTVKVWSSRDVAVSFKLEEIGNPGGGRTTDVRHTGSGTWEKLCFDFTGQTVSIPNPPMTAVTIFFDLGVLGMADTDPNNWTFYYDDIQPVASCPKGGGGGTATSVDFEGDPANFDFGMGGGFGGGVSTVIANPDMSGINMSGQVVQMQKFAGEVFGGSTLALGSDIEFAEGEAFTVKVWASRAVPVLFKLEGLKRERSVTHMGSGMWEELCFDFTADTAGAASNAITFIFDLRVNGDAAGDPNNWTFYYDDIQPVASCPKGGGGGTATSVDFEGDPANFDFGMGGGFGGGVSTVIANPDMSGINMSGQVVQMQKFAGEVFGGSTLALGSDIEFAEGEAFTVKVWASRAVPVLFKLEGLKRERSVTHMGSGMWEELCFDFTADTAGAASNAITFIFDLRVNGDAAGDPNNWTFYYDDIQPVASCPKGGGGGTATSVDFEGDPANFDFGMGGGFGGGVSTVIANPDMSGINMSGQVVQMQKFAGEVFGGSTLALGSDIEFAEGEAFTVKVWASRAVPVLFKLEGLKRERSVTHMGSGMWEELCFDFTADTAGAASNAITFIFDLRVNGDAAGDPNNWTFYYDDIQPVASCPKGGGGGTATSVDFEGDPANFDFGMGGGFGGGVSTVIANPDMSGINMSGQVVQMQKFAGEVFGGSTLALGSDIEFAEGEAFTVKVWASRAVPVLFKLEGLKRERSVTHMGSGMWEELCFDFTADTAGAASNAITFIFDLRVNGDAAGDPNNWTFYYDDIQPVASCPKGGGGGTATSVDFEGDPANFDFGMGGGFGGGVSTVIANPDMSGINMSGQVVQMQKFAGEVFGGSTLALGSDIEFAEGEAFTVKVWASRAVPVLFKLEGLKRERSVTHMGSGMWEELCFDFTADTAGAASNAITFIFDLRVNGDAAGDPNNWTFYYDDIQPVASCPKGGGGGTATSVDFEGDPANFDFGMGGGFGGGVSTVIANPDMSGINMSGQVVQMQKFAGEVFGGSTLALGSDIEFAEGEAFTVKVWASRAVPVLFKLEGLKRERSVTHMGSGMWEELCFDFTADTAGAASNAITFIFDLRVNGDAAGDPNNWTFYYDDIQPVASCPKGGGGGTATSVDFEGDPANFDFGMGGGFGGGVSTVIANPDMSGINMSGQVVQMQKFAGEVFGGSTLALGSDIEFAEGEAFTVKVWASRAVPVLFKLEGLKRERSVTHMGSGMWEELCFDFTADTAGAASNAITFIFDLRVNGDAAGDPNNWTFYYDDIQPVASCPKGGGGGTATSGSHRFPVQSNRAGFVTGHDSADNFDPMTDSDPNVSASGTQKDAAAIRIFSPVVPLLTVLSGIVLGLVLPLDLNLLLQAGSTC